MANPRIRFPRLQDGFSPNCVFIALVKRRPRYSTLIMLRHTTYLNEFRILNSRSARSALITRNTRKMEVAPNILNVVDIMGRKRSSMIKIIITKSTIEARTKTQIQRFKQEHRILHCCDFSLDRPYLKRHWPVLACLEYCF